MSPLFFFIAIFLLVIALFVSLFFSKKIFLTILVFFTSLIAFSYYLLKVNASMLQSILNFTGIPFVDTAEHVDSAASLIEELRIFFKNNAKVKSIGRAGANPYLYLIFETDGELKLSADEISEIKKLAENSYSKRVYINFYDMEKIGKFGENYNCILDEPKHLQLRIK